MTDASISFPRQNARTIGFSLGVPHSFAIAPDGGRIAFLRAPDDTRVELVQPGKVAGGCC